jgi:dihydrolipoamide dehydrogenase
VNKKKVVVIGAGPGGYEAAIYASKAGFEVTLIEKEALGGLCLNWGCIPTKALLKSGELYSQLSHAKNFGIHVENLSFNLPAAVKRSLEIIEKLNSGIKSLMQKHNINVIYGHAKLCGKTQADMHKISITSHKPDNSEATLLEITANYIILAVGAKYRTMTSIAEDMLWSYKEAMRSSVIPENLVIIGAGAIGLEFGSFYNAIGSKVTIIEMSNNILPSIDTDISKYAKKVFEKRGITFINGVSVVEAKNGLVELSNGVQIHATQVLCAIGVEGATVDNLGIENTKIKLNRGFVDLEHGYETHEKFIYAIGDTIGNPCLAHKSTMDAVLLCAYLKTINSNKNNVIDNNSEEFNRMTAAIINTNDITNSDSLVVNHLRVPACVYTYPQIACVGMSEVLAREQYGDDNVLISKSYMSANGKAICIGEPEGIIKVVTHKKTNEILGAHMCGPYVTELISNFCVLIEAEGTANEFLLTIFPHPTLSESLSAAVERE